jgi:EAL domain-containing protein (putative c-di-GMP-specific phosphodiesterase class I)
MATTSFQNAELSSASRKTPRVLVVDDDPRLLRACARTLERSGYRVVCAANGEEALAIVNAEQVDLVVSDILLPQMTGVELLSTIRLERSSLPVILTTGAPTLESATHAVDLGASAYLAKPFDVHKLRSTVRRALERSKLTELSASGVRRLPGAGVSMDAAIDKLWVALQPIQQSQDGSIFGYEALMRSDHPAFPHPGVLLEFAVRANAVWALGRAMRDRIARAALTLQDHQHVFVNVSPRELTDPELYSPSSALGTMAHRVVLEITERASLDEVDDVPGRIQALRKLGYRIAVDDLGVGYSGLAAMVMLEPDIVKIDMSLVRDVQASSRKQTLIRSVTQISKDLGVRVVAEGIESEPERDTIVALGCDLLQGYFIGRPARCG